MEKRVIAHSLSCPCSSGKHRETRKVTGRGLKAYLPIETHCNRDPFAYKAEQIPQRALQESLLGFNKATKTNWLYTGAQLPKRRQIRQNNENHTL